MNEYEDEVETYIAFKKQNKDNYMATLSTLASEYKMNYPELTDYYKGEADNKKADNIFEYSKLLEKIKDKGITDFEQAYSYSVSYEDALEKLSNSLKEKAKIINESLSKDSIETVINFGDKIDKLADE